MFEQPVGIDRRPRTRNNEQHPHLAQVLMRDAYPSAVEDSWKFVHRLLDLGGGDVLAAADDQLLQPAGDGEETVGVAPGKIARAIPSLSQGRCRLGRLVVISEHDVGATHNELSL